MGWKLWDHTADVGIDADGNDPGECLSMAAHAITAIATGKPRGVPLRGGEAIDIRVEAPDHESLAVAFLSEVLWLLESRGLLWTSGGVTVSSNADGLVAAGGANMVAHNARSHGRGVEIKAVTYHDLFFGRDGNRWRLRVVLDI